MPLTNTVDRFGTVSKTFHWLTALGILVLMPLGLIANRMPYETSEQLADKAWMFSMHKTLGVAVFFIALARIVWALSQPKPGLLHPERQIETLAAETVHWLLYGSLVLVPLSGWIHHAATAGFAPIWWPFGQDLPLVAKSETLAALFGGAHWVLTKVLGLALLLHIAGALKHHVIDKDATLRRMWFTTTEVTYTARSHSHARPATLALAIWAVALSVGAALGAYAPHDTPGEAAALEQVQSEWEVQEGTLSITVTQLGSEVTGSFADWTAAIRFDETTEVGTAGAVDVTIAIGSLTLGAVSGQALGPDYFNATDFPTARYVADIVSVVDGFEAQGTLTIKDKSIPLTLPFGLSVDDNTAWMIAAITLDRRDFGIGDNMADETSLKFAVAVDIELMATRATDE
ncbi:cytochrome b/b6 domain-containing protein [uncultured Tateyamaria sp.]|uniref:cytochrome b/b6 domain-containing protein n=1 Tax=uncultured Tateyamaria sp. TaxID=455651 RepID=UPI00262C996D|nr:cytochrome b/b6 domain-containing protein [uncultured Tateyamaria sp.]